MLAEPDVDRLCMVADMVVSADGEVSAYQFYPAVMHSHARFTYTEVAAILANTRGLEAAKRQRRVPDLLNLHDVYKALLAARGRRGAVDFETTETQIISDENGRIEKIVPRTRTEAHRLIRKAMLAASVCAVLTLLSKGVSRACSAYTKAQRLKSRTFCVVTSRPWVWGCRSSDDPKPAEFQAIALATKERLSTTAKSIRCCCARCSKRFYAN